MRRIFFPFHSTGSDSSVPTVLVLTVGTYFCSCWRDIETETANSLAILHAKSLFSAQLKIFRHRAIVQCYYISHRQCQHFSVPHLRPASF